MDKVSIVWIIRLKFDAYSQNLCPIVSVVNSVSF